MANPLADDDFIECKFYCSKGQQLGINVVHYRVNASTGSGCTDQEVATAFDVSFANPYATCISADSFYEGTAVKKISGAPFVPVYAHSNVTAGLLASAVLPTQVSGIVTKLSAFAGRANRGRFYVPFPATQELDTDETPKAAYVTLIQALADTVITDHTIIGAGGTCQLSPQIVNRGLTHNVKVVANLARKRWATQRRRGDFGRPNVLPW